MRWLTVTRRTPKSTSPCVTSRPRLVPLRQRRPVTWVTFTPHHHWRTWTKWGNFAVFPLNSCLLILAPVLPEWWLKYINLLHCVNTVTNLIIVSLDRKTSTRLFFFLLILCVNSLLFVDFSSSLWCCDVSDLPQHSAVVSQDKKEETSEEDIYEYDCPRPVAPPAPTRRAVSDIIAPSAAFSALSIDGAVEASMYFCCLQVKWHSAHIHVICLLVLLIVNWHRPTAHVCEILHLRYPFPIFLTVIPSPVCLQLVLTLNVRPNLSRGEPTLTDGLGLSTVNFLLHYQTFLDPPPPLPPLLLFLLLLLLQAQEAWPLMGRLNAWCPKATPFRTSKKPWWSPRTTWRRPRTSCASLSPSLPRLTLPHSHFRHAHPLSPVSVSTLCHYHELLYQALSCRATSNAAFTSWQPSSSTAAGITVFPSGGLVWKHMILIILDCLYANAVRMEMPLS